jgi:D-alanine-D-alanine ligase
MAKKHVAVVMVGYSSEFEISLGSGGVVWDAVDTEKYKVYPVHILESGWHYVNPSGEKSPINKADFSFQVGSEIVTPDVVFNCIHGTPGEDGYLAAYLELLKIPQTSSGFYEAALTFNKRDCLSVLKSFGIHCATSYYVNNGDTIDPAKIISEVGLPCFVKPNRAGSSFGISKVHTSEALLPSLEKAFKEDSEVIIETALVGTELSVGAYKRNGEIVVLPPTEIVSENDFFDYEAKYLGKSDEITPARVPKAIIKMVQDETKRIYKILNMSGVARGEFILQDDIPYFLEINSVPGISAESIVPKQVKATGMALTEFFGILIDEALR